MKTVNQVIDICQIMGDGREAPDFVCPVCFSENVHFGKPVFKDGNDNYEADWGGRGSLIHIPMISEQCDHAWEICFGFHKGDTKFFYRIIENRKIAEGKTVR